jgi:hypothetical protein
LIGAYVGWWQRASCSSREKSCRKERVSRHSADRQMPRGIEVAEGPIEQARLQGVAEESPDEMGEGKRYSEVGLERELPHAAERCG